MSKWFVVMGLALLMASLVSATYFEKMMAGGASTEVSLSTLTTSVQDGTNTYLMFNSSNASDTENIVVDYYTSDFVAKRINYSLNGGTPVYTNGTNYVYTIANPTVYTAIALGVTNGTFTSPGKNASLQCDNYSNVYYVSYTSANYTTNINSTSANNLNNYDSGGTAYLYGVQLTNVTFTKNTYPTALWYYSNPAITMDNLYRTAVNVYLPDGEYFVSTANFSVTSNMNYSWINASNHSEGYEVVTVTVIPNADLRSFNISTNATNPTSQTGYVIIPSAKLVQNKRVVADTVKLQKCVNATLLIANNGNITTTNFTRSGSIKAASNDIAYVTKVQLSRAANGTVVVKDDSGSTLYSILTTTTTPVDNGGSFLCYNPTGCVIRSLSYGGDGAFRLRANVTSPAGVTRTAFSSYIPAWTTYSFGSGVIRWGAGERLFFTGMPSTNNTNMSLYYEVG